MEGFLQKDVHDKMKMREGLKSLLSVLIRFN